MEAEEEGEPKEENLPRPNDERILAIKLVYLFLVAMWCILFVGTFYLPAREALFFITLLFVFTGGLTLFLRHILAVYFQMDLYTVLIQRCPTNVYSPPCII